MRTFETLHARPQRLQSPQSVFLFADDRLQFAVGLRDVVLRHQRDAAEGECEEERKSGHGGLRPGRELLRFAADALLEFDQILQTLDDVEVVLPSEQAVFEDAEILDERFWAARPERASAIRASGEAARAACPEPTRRLGRRDGGRTDEEIEDVDETAHQLRVARERTGVVQGATVEDEAVFRRLRAPRAEEISEQPIGERARVEAVVEIAVEHARELAGRRGDFDRQSGLRGFDVLQRLHGVGATPSPPDVAFASTSFGFGEADLGEAHEVAHPIPESRLLLCGDPVRPPRGA
jgi:hypothetical protein